MTVTNLESTLPAPKNRAIRPADRIAAAAVYLLAFAFIYSFMQSGECRHLGNR